MDNNKLIKVVSVIDTTVFIVTSTLLVLLTVFGVFMRYVANNPLTWLEEVQMILIVQASFFGGSIAFRKRGHVVVDILVDTFSPKMQKIVGICTWILVFAALILIGWQEGIRTYRQIINGRVTNILKIPMWIDWAGVTIATFLMLINHIYVGIDNYKKEKEEGK